MARGVCVCGCARAVLNMCVVAGELIAFTCVWCVARVESQQGEAQDGSEAEAAFELHGASG